MSYVGSIFHIIDNTGGLKVKCLCAYGKRKITFGSYVLLVLKRIKPNNKKLQKGLKIKGYVLNLDKLWRRRGGHLMRPNRNTALLLKKNGDPMGSRLKGMVLSEMKFLRNFSKVMSIANYVL
jgi:large subunit ribosomal protein L14